MNYIYALLCGLALITSTIAARPAKGRRFNKKPSVTTPATPKQAVTLPQNHPSNTYVAVNKKTNTRNKPEGSTGVTLNFSPGTTKQVLK